MPPEKDVIAKNLILWKQYQYQRNSSKLDFSLRQDIPDNLNDYIALLQEALKEVQMDLAMNFPNKEVKEKKQ